MALFVSCTESYPGMDYESDMDDIYNSEGSSNIPVTLYLHDAAFFDITTTRGSGAFDKNDPHNEDRIKNAIFRVYAFKDAYQNVNDDDVDMTKTMDNDKDCEFCLIDNSSDPELKKWGKATKINEQTYNMEFLKDAVAKDVDENIYYSGVHQKTGYNFFGYFIDMAKVDSTIRKKDRIYHNIVIDGTYDIMYGLANLNKTDSLRVLEIYKNRYGDARPYLKDISEIMSAGYSTFSAHRGIHPIINLNHGLTKLKFLAYPGDKTAKNIIIKNIEVLTNVKLRFTVAANDTTLLGLVPIYPDVRNSVFLADYNESTGSYEPGLRKEYVVQFNDDELGDKIHWSDRTPLKIGTSMMIMPAETISLRLHYDEVLYSKEGVIIDTVTVKPAEYKIAAPSGKFKAGRENTIHIAVFGSQPIQVTTNINAWEQGDSVLLDPDDPNFEW